jgi:hypothetical protein
MPRGNDAQTAAEELRERYSEGVGSAEDLIRSSNALNPPELQAASLRREDEEADLDLDDVAKKAGEDDVLSATKRGDDIVYVAEREEDGRWFKGVLVGGKEAVEFEGDRHLTRLEEARKESEKAVKSAKDVKSKPSGEEAKAQKDRSKAREKAAEAGSVRQSQRLAREAEGSDKKS